jgi:glycosyltransferase involved in cell wall biosynthesis
MERPRRILHIEVGGTYGGSLRALEMYFAYSQREDFQHELLFYFPTSGLGPLGSRVRSVDSLYSDRPEWMGMQVNGRGWLRSHTSRLASNRGTREFAAWLSLLKRAPQIRLLCRKFRDGHYDLIHVNNTFTYQAASIVAANLCHIPVVAHVRNPVERGLFARGILNRLSAVATVSGNYTRELTSWGSHRRIQTCHDGVQTPACDPAAAAALRASLLGNGSRLIGAVGRLDRQKGFADLVKAAALVCRAHPDVRFAIAGEGPERPGLEALIAKLNLADRFQLCGFRSDIGTYLSALDLFVSSSLWEGLPIAVVEAMLLAKPVVATDVGGVSEVVIPGKTGILAKAGDPEGLAAAILASLEAAPLSAGQRREISSRAASVTDPLKSAVALDELMACSLQ